MTLKVDLLGLKMSTPFLVASGHLQGEGSRIKNWVKELRENKWGGIITKTYLKGFESLLMPYLWSSREYRKVGMQNAGPGLTEPDDLEMKGLKESCKRAHEEGLAVVGSIMGRFPSEWQELVGQVEEAGVDALELNLSCPAKIDEIETAAVGYRIGQIPDEAAEVTKIVKEVATVPVIPKLTPNVSSIVGIAKACKDAGADGLSAINTVQGLIGVDVETGIPYSSDYQGRAYVSGLSGPMIRPIGLFNVSEICANVDVPVLGIGGVEDWRSAVEYIMVGAAAVQVCTAFMWKGYGLGQKMYEGLVAFMDRKGYDSVDDFRGIALKHITTASEKAAIVAVVDGDKCNGCGLCIKPCNETQFDAMSLVEKIAVVNEEKCGGCGLCRVLCPQEAISYKRR